jgi:hypothetical protein
MKKGIASFQLTALLLLATVLLGSCGSVTSSPAPPLATPIVPQTTGVVMGDEFLWADVHTPTGKPGLPQARALDMAKLHLAGTGEIAATQARYVALTLRTGDGTVVDGIQNRAVWLVTFQGFTYAPPGSPQTNCGCGGYYIRPNTTVALDGNDGSLVVEYGE